MKPIQIIVRDLSKTYRVPVRDAGLLASLKSLWAREYRSVEAVKSVSFTIEEGEIVGFLGPNGAGKTSTLKMLAGLLYPTTGEAQVAGATIILTSHYMADVEALCPRVIMINHGRLIYDGSLRMLASRFASHKLLRLVVSDEYVAHSADLALPAGVQVSERENATWTLNVPQSEVASVTSYLLNSLPVLDLAIEEPPIESVIDHLYQGGEL